METSSLHTLLLLSDSALPLGSFAFSSGLESYLAHHKLQKQSQAAAAARTGTETSNLPKTNSNGSARQPLTAIQDFEVFLEMSLANLASTTLPYVLDAYHNPTHLADLDNDLDASTPCTVARRASITQGKALLSLWERALAPVAIAADISTPTSTSSSGDTTLSDTSTRRQASKDAVTQIIARLKAGGNSNSNKNINNSSSSSSSTNDRAMAAAAQGLQTTTAHFAPLLGAVCSALALSAHETAYLYLLNHAKAVLSAAVRASVMGPYQSHAILASTGLQAKIRECVDRESGKGVEDAGLVVPPMDLWMGRHELLYSRIFNS